MLPDRVPNPGPLTYESGALPIALRGPAYFLWETMEKYSRLSSAAVVIGALRANIRAPDGDLKIILGQFF